MRTKVLGMCGATALVAVGSVALVVHSRVPGTTVVAASGQAGSIPETPGSIEPRSVVILVDQQVQHTKASFPVTLTNNGKLEATIVGIPGLCNQEGCADAEDLPGPIPPGRSVTFSLRFRAHRPGKVNQSMTAYLATGDGGGVRIPITFTGSVIEPGGKP